MNTLHLAIDTSSSFPAVALLEDETSLTQWCGSSGPFHGEELLGGIDHCLRDQNKGLSDLDFLSVGIGPGTFTGLRIGIVMAKFLADTHGLPIVPVSSLQAQLLNALELTDQITGNPKIWSLHDARRKEVYALAENWSELQNGVIEKKYEEFAHAPESLAAKLQPGDWLLGEGALNYADAWPDSINIAPESNCKMSCVPMGLIGITRFRKGETIDPVALTPIYMKTEKF